MERTTIKDIYIYPQNVLIWLHIKTYGTIIGAECGVKVHSNYKKLIEIYEDTINNISGSSESIINITDQLAKDLISYDKFWKGEGTLKEVMRQSHPKGNLSRTVDRLDMFLLSYPVFDFINNSIDERLSRPLADSVEGVENQNNDLPLLNSHEFYCISNHISGPTKKVKDIVVGDVINLALKAILKKEKIQDVVYKAGIDEREDIVNYIETVVKMRNNILKGE